MRRKSFLSLCLFAVLIPAGSATADPNGHVETTWSGSVSTAWSDANNWSDGVPDSNDSARIDNNLSNPCEIGFGVSAVAWRMNGPGWSTGNGRLDITGGTLTIDPDQYGGDTYFRCGAAGGGSEINMSSGYVDMTNFSGDANQFFVGWKGNTGTTDVLNMSGGTIETASDGRVVAGCDSDGDGRINLTGDTITTGEFCVGWAGKGTLDMDSGSIDCAEFKIGMDAGGDGTVHLDGGTINVGSNGLTMTSSGSMDITGGGGTMIIDGDHTTTINQYVTNGWIIADGGVGVVEVNYNTTNPGKTTITAAADYIYWENDFDNINLSISSRDSEPNDSAMATLGLTGDVDITADNNDTAQLSSATDVLITEYRLIFDGDGSSISGGASETTWTAYNSFLSPAVTVTHISDDDEVVVTLHVQASNPAGEVADAGSYTATQTLTLSWAGE